MDKDQFPQEDDFLNQEPSPVPGQESLPEEPEIVELSFTPEPSGPAQDAAPLSPLPEDTSEPQEAFSAEEAPVLPDMPSVEDAPVLPEELFAEDASTLPEPFSPESETPSEAPAQSSFMDRIPDVEDGCRRRL